MLDPQQFRSMCRELEKLSASTAIVRVGPAAPGYKAQVNAAKLRERTVTRLKRKGHKISPDQDKTIAQKAIAYAKARNKSGIRDPGARKARKHFGKYVKNIENPGLWHRLKSKIKSTSSKNVEPWGLGTPPEMQGLKDRNAKYTRRARLALGGMAVAGGTAYGIHKYRQRKKEQQKAARARS